MPVRFRCSECRSKLSIARRKIGTAVACPTCHHTVTVPAVDDDRDQATELLPFAGMTTATRPASQARVEVAARAKTPVPAVDPDSLPLFERTDFERMLEPAVKAAREAAEPTEAIAPPTYVPRAGSVDGFLVLRSTVVVLTAAVVVLIALAFAAGFVMGSR